jgi:hypothetical protein
MEPPIWMGLGAAGVVGLILTRLAAKHGWAALDAKLKAKASATEAAFAAKVSAAAGDLETKVKAAVDTELTSIQARVVAIEAHPALAVPPLQKV